MSANKKEQKILELHGFKYSREELENYKFRFIVLAKTVDNSEHKIDVYTTNPDIESAYYVLLSRKTEKVASLEIIHHATKEQDDAASKFIDEIIDKL